MQKLISNSSVPLYKQLADFLIDEFDKVKNNEPSVYIDENDKLPTERFLSDTFDVSRVTVRQAMDLLEKENYIYRKQGKGTFYNKDKIVRSVRETNSFSNIILSNGRVPGAKLISASIELSSKIDQKYFGIGDDDYVLIMKRLRYVDNVPCAFEITHFDRSLFDLKDFDFNNKSIYQYLRENKGIIISSIDKTIEIVYSNEEISRAFNIDINTPVVLLKSISVNQENKPIIIAYEYLLSDKFIFKL